MTFPSAFSSQYVTNGAVYVAGVNRVYDTKKRDPPNMKYAVT